MESIPAGRLDVHKKILPLVCGRAREEPKRKALRDFTHDLLQLADCSRSARNACGHDPPGVLEAGWNILRTVEVAVKRNTSKLCPPQDDQKDSEWMRTCCSTDAPRISCPRNPHVNSRPHAVRVSLYKRSTGCESKSEGAGGSNISGIGSDRCLGAQERSWRQCRGQDAPAGGESKGSAEQIPNCSWRSKVDDRHHRFCCDSFTIICAHESKRVRSTGIEKRSAL